MVSLRILTDVALLDQDSPEVRNVTGIIKTFLPVSTCAVTTCLVTFGRKETSTSHFLKERRRYSEEFERNTRKILLRGNKWHGLAFSAARNSWKASKEVALTTAPPPAKGTVAFCWYE